MSADKSRGDNDQDLLLGPLVLSLYLSFLLGGKVVLDVEQLSDLLGSLALDHVGDSLATQVEQRLDVQIVGSEDDFEEHLLVNLDELAVPFGDVDVPSSGLLGGIVGIGRGGQGVVLVVLAPFEDL